MLLFLTAFIGRLHPALVHLPIGILVIGILLHWLSASPKYAISAGAVRIVLLAGAFTALLACISGFFVPPSEKYPTDLVSLHMWAGISLAAAALLLLQRILTKQNNTATRVLAVLLLALIVLTGYLGGSLAHGPGYLGAPSKSERDTLTKRTWSGHMQEE